MNSVQTLPSFHLPACAIFDLSGRTRLLFSGADRVRYLNGQVTQDLKKLRPGHALPACVTSAKGRLQADVWVAFSGDEHGPVSVDAAPELREALAARLERYIVADDVVMEDVTDNGHLLHCVGFAAPGPGKADQSAEVVGTETTAAVPRLPGLLDGFPRVAASRLGEQGWDVLVPLGELATIQQELGDLFESGEDWEKRRILRGIPAWGKELDENTLPPEAGLERTHIDYHKGCYIGQEVISRLKSVGHVNRTLHLLSGIGEALPAAGAIFFTEAGAEAGSLTSVTRLGPEAFLALGYVKRACQAGHFSTPSGTPLVVVSP